MYVTNFSDDSNTLRHNLGEALFNDVTGSAGPAAADDSVSGLGHGIPGFRQRRLAGSVRRQRPRLSAGGPIRLGHDVGATTAAVQQPRRASGSRRCPRRQERAGRRAIGPRRGIRRSRSRRPHRRRRQQSGRRPDAAEECRNGRALGVDRADRRQRRAARCDWRRRDGGGRAQRLRQDVVSGGSYCSQNDLRAHFGLGATGRVDRIIVRWPGGSREAFNAPGIDRRRR